MDLAASQRLFHMDDDFVNLMYGKEYRIIDVEDDGKGDSDDDEAEEEAEPEVAK